MIAWLILAWLTAGTVLIVAQLALLALHLGDLKIQMRTLILLLQDQAQARPATAQQQKTVA
ncbi:MULTISPECIES: hypothetical protein [Mycobacterium]|uniref:hypothetical protein n=1 Tax=Mycobacterium TaxID=1763 RepID=UPI001EF05FFB|nr:MULTISPECIES: hypothetical protein [Mycobacterium]BDB44555.1 hypothetical protein IWGMT90018_50010 [Mycobacterium kiyosense]BDE16061.1 hypothetical protein MKCMC460_49210 [Mycobacterium sp. 20KCMC460]GLB93045.1 hypothetical protein SRL2020130_58620 [Mycobacterium kiyosense]GLC04840.1 hypothetical protein SRL2020400_54310 [Mycobacterium kiyosense]GLC11242.1 hypothetical protein SRL2020411_58880 [Mycobacterium kiyosense]